MDAVQLGASDNGSMTKAPLPLALSEFGTEPVCKLFEANETEAWSCDPSLLSSWEVDGESGDVARISNVHSPRTADQALSGLR